MTEDMLRQSSTGRDEPRQSTTSPDQYTLSIDDALLRYEHAGYPRTPRSVQRYCAKGHLDCLRQETMFGDKFMITPQSVARHIAQIHELASATNRDETRHVATDVAAASPPISAATPPPQATTTSPDQPRHVATGPAPLVAADADVRYVKQLERENDFLRDQVQRKDTQIGELTERAKETNFLIKGLQDLVLRLQPPRPHDDRGMVASEQV